MVSMKKNKLLPVRIEEDIHKELRHRAIDEDKSMAQIIRELIIKFLQKGK